MLWTDGPFVTFESLNIIDGEIAQVASDNNIDITTGENSIITRSCNAAGTDFLSRIQNFSGYLMSIGPNANAAAAVLNVLSTAINRPRVLLHQVTVDEPDRTSTATRRWVEYCCLHDFYRSVYHRKINDRFEKKMNMYAAERKRHWDILSGTGFPIVLTPLSAPGATRLYGSGTWGTPSNLTLAAGGTAPAQVTRYQVAVTWCALPAYVNYANQGQAESAGSEPAPILIPPNGADNLIQVNIGSLNPPTGLMSPAVGTAQGFYPPMAATHWNVYAGTVGSTLTQQNATPIPVATKTYTFSGLPTTTGGALNPGQPSSYFFSVQNVIWRA